MSKNWIVVDLDGTLCDIGRRKEHILNKDYDSFHGALYEDKPFRHIATMLTYLQEHYQLLAVTGRPDTYHERTWSWLRANQLDIFEAVLMRPSKDFTPDHELKLVRIDEFFGGREFALESVSFCLDDRDKVVQSLRDAGFKVLQVAEGDY